MNQPNQYEGGGTKTVSMFSKLVSQGSSFVMEGVKNLVVKRHVSVNLLIESYFIQILPLLISFFSNATFIEFTSD